LFGWEGEGGRREEGKGIRDKGRGKRDKGKGIMWI
jgi:hypothetical protein